MTANGNGRPGSGAAVDQVGAGSTATLPQRTHPSGEPCRVPGAAGYAPLDGTVPPAPEERGRPPRPEPPAARPPRVVVEVDLTNLDEDAAELLRHDRTVRARISEVLAAPPGSAVVVRVGRLPADITSAAPGLWRTLVRRYAVDVRAAGSGAARWEQTLRDLAGWSS